ncbi:MAG: IS1634 family transposase [Candidatus Enterosoma sp.]|nr:IS1634 family transposase [Candidatus Enterosoma sp.]
MAYFLRKTRRKNGDIYYQIYDSYYSAEERKNKNRSVEKLGLLSSLRREGESDSECEQRLRGMVSERERDRSGKQAKQIDDNDELVNYGYFLLEGMVRHLDIRKQIDLLTLGSRIRFSLSDVLFSLADARVIDPCSKWKTFAEVFPLMYEDPTKKISLSQMYSGVCFLGTVVQDVVDILNAAIDKRFGRSLDRVYFDCTNYYFEIDCESGIKRRGPSKENRTSPIVSMALLLDSDLIPYQMEIFPGNESEKPRLPRALDRIREEKGKESKIIQMADKGLNCAENIRKCGKNDGYIFSKAPKMMADKDLEWMFDEKGWTDVMDKNGEVSYRYKSVTDVYDYEFKDENGKTVKFTKAEKRVATFNPSLRKKQAIELTRQYDKAMKKTASAQIKEAVGGKNAKMISVDAVSKKTGEELEDAQIVLSGNKEKLEHDLKLAGYNILITSEVAMKESEIYDVYHKLWNIERTFRMMKTQLAARPAFASTDDGIRGHFLTCYTSIVLLRLLEKKVFSGQFTVEEIIEYIKKARAFRLSDNDYCNLLKRKDAAISEYIQKRTELPLLNKRLTDSKIKSFFNTKNAQIVRPGK